MGNLAGFFQPAVEGVVGRYSKVPHVIGVALLGGYAKRGEIDEFSDIDIAVLFDGVPEGHQLMPFSYNMRYKERTVEFNISQILYRDNKDAAWPMAQVEAYANGKILYDPTGHFKELIAEKTGQARNQIVDQIVDNLNQYQWRVQYHAPNAAKRGFNVAAHALVSEGISLLGNAALLLADRFTPHTKWIESEIEAAYGPNNPIIQGLKKATIVKSMDDVTLKGRIKTLDNVFSFIELEARKKYPDFPENYYKHWARNTSKRQLQKYTFADRVCESLSSEFSKADKEILYGIIGANLPQSLEELGSCLEQMNGDFITEKEKSAFLSGVKKLINKGWNP